MKVTKDNKEENKRKNKKEDDFKILVTYAKNGKIFQEVFQNILLRRMDEID